IGPSLEEEAPELDRWLGLGGSRERTIVWLCPGRGAKPMRGETHIGRGVDQLPTLLAALRARIAGRPAGKAGVATKAIADLAARLEAARFGVAVWSATGLDPLVIEMLFGHVTD